jgi:glycosyltransferase involved in cell wall biosynthesis
MTQRRRARLLFLIDRLLVGGSELQLVALLRGLDRARYHVHFAHFRENDPDMFGIDIGETETICLGRSGRYDPRLMLRLVSLIRRWEIDLVYTVLPTADMWGRIAGCLAGRPALVSRKGTVLSGGDRESYEGLVDRILRPLTDLVVVNSRLGLEDLVRDHRADSHRAVVIHNGTDCERFSPPTLEARMRMRERLGLPNSAVVIGGVGRLSHEKGWETLVEAMARLPTLLGRDFSCVIAGDGPLRRILEERIAHHALSDRIRLLGFRSDVSEIFAAVDVVVMPSYQEGSPNSLCEAMAMAKPVVATRVGGVPELVEHGRSGLLVEPYKSGELASALATLLGDPEAGARLGAHGRQRVVALFSLERMVAETDRALQGVLARRVTMPTNDRVIAGRR